MRNKWYVAGVLIPAAALAWGTVSILVHGGGWVALVPGALAVALVVVAVRVGRSASFAPTPAPSRLQETGSPALERWKQHHVDEAERDTAQANATAAAPASSPAATPPAH